MEQYIFSVHINGLRYDIKSDFEDYEIWQNDRMLFTLMPGVDEINASRWIVKGPSMADSVLVEKLGNEIQKNCCS